MEKKFTSNEEKFCTSCGEKINIYAEVCPRCGVAQNNVFQTNAEKKSLLTTLLLANILGIFGIHNFYIGKTVKGVFSIIFFWTNIPLIFSLVDILIMSKGKIENLNKRYKTTFTDTEQTAKTIFFIIALIILIGIAISILSYAFIIMIASIFSGSSSTEFFFNMIN